MAISVYLVRVPTDGERRFIMKEERQRLIVANKDDRLIIIKILAMNDYTTRLVTDKVDGKKVTFVEYWREV
jgi:hypothetical protein